MYHSISPDRNDPYNLTIGPQRFEAQMNFLHRCGIRGVSIRELLALRAQGSWTPGRFVGLTFDDGYDDFIEYALPVLSRHGFTATVFALAGRLGGDNEWDPAGPRKPLMTADGLRTVAAAGMEVGSHGLLHLRLPSERDDVVQREIVESKRILQDVTGQEVTGFCYPHGLLDDRVVRIVQEAGYNYACAIWRNRWKHPYALTRVEFPLPIRMVKSASQRGRDFLVRTRIRTAQEGKRLRQAFVDPRPPAVRETKPHFSEGRGEPEREVVGPGRE